MFRFLLTLVVSALLISVAYTFNGIRLHSSLIFLPNVIRFWIAAIALGIIQGFHERSAPAVSVRLFHSSITAGTLFMAVPSVLWLWSLRSLPLSLIMLSMSLVPIWANAFYRFRLPYLYPTLISLVGFVLIGSGISPGFNRWDALAACLLASVSSAGAFALSRHLFWIHSHVNLNLWSMVSAAILLLPCVIITGEIKFLPELSSRFWTHLGLLTLIGTALGSFVYRKFSFKLDNLSASTVAVVPPIAILIYGLLTQSETLSPIGVIGWILALFPVLYITRSGNPLNYLTHYLANSNRVGDRLEVNISGYVKVGNMSGNIQITSISIGGLGFETSVYCPVSEGVTVTIPLGKNFTQVSFDTVCAYTAKKSAGSDIWKGGLAFQKLNLSTTQIIAEFVARLSKAEQSDIPAIEIRKESKAS